MPRPKKNPEELKAEFETFRRSPADKLIIDKLVEASGLTRSEYLRQAAKKQKIGAPVTPLISGLMAQLKALALELDRQGNNSNQRAIKAHTLHQVESAALLQREHAETRETRAKIVKAVEKLLNRVLRG
jgi:hypothetical protein